MISIESHWYSCSDIEHTCSNDTIIGCARLSSICVGNTASNSAQLHNALLVQLLYVTVISAQDLCRDSDAPAAGRAAPRNR